MSVHLSSGIYSHAFWLLSNSLGVRNALECIFYAAKMYWTQFISFEEGYCGVVRAAYHSGFDMEVIKESFSQTGIKGYDCPKLGKLVTTLLRPGQPRRRLRVSSLRRPLFRVRLSAGVTRLRVEATPSHVTICISESWKRSVPPVVMGS